MNFQKIREAVKSKIANDTLYYAVMQSTYYKIKKFLDFLFFKFRYPLTKWIYIFKGIDSSESFSQFGQDKFILKLMGKERGRYVEVGANHPIRLNNSFLLERCNWTGISIDPLSKYNQEWLKLRKQTFVNVAIGDIDTTLQFVEFSGSESWYDMMSGFKQYIRPEDLITFSSIEYEVQVKKLDKVIPFDTFDVLLIDVEGAEMQVLKGLDLSKHRPKYVLLENATFIGGDSNLRKYMRTKGYKLITRIGCTDDVFERINES
jgi:FkbM family methyltransferase